MQISIHALREEGDCVCGVYTALVVISIHALREEGDVSFQRRREAGRISIHALREEGDFVDGRQELMTSIISIHALREEGDDERTAEQPRKCGFLSTPSARRATIYNEWFRDENVISIHALREEGDLFLLRSMSLIVDFYPRPPRGGRR